MSRSKADWRLDREYEGIVPFATPGFGMASCPLLIGCFCTAGADDMRKAIGPSVQFRAGLNIIYVSYSLNIVISTALAETACHVSNPSVRRRDICTRTPLAAL